MYIHLCTSDHLSGETTYIQRPKYSARLWVCKLYRVSTSGQQFPINAGQFHVLSMDSSFWKTRLTRLKKVNCKSKSYTH